MVPLSAWAYRLLVTDSRTAKRSSDILPASNLRHIIICLAGPFFPGLGGARSFGAQASTRVWTRHAESVRHDAVRCMLSVQTWRTHSCVPRRDSSRRSAGEKSGLGEG